METNIEHYIGTNKQSSHMEGQSPNEHTTKTDLKDRVNGGKLIDSVGSSDHQLMYDLDLIVKEEPIEINDINETKNENKIGDIAKATQFDDGSWECEICFKILKYKNTLVRHYRCHLSEKMFECSVCNLKLSQHQNLVAHMRRHTGEKPFHCTVCGHMFRQRSNLNSHLRKHSNFKPFKCDFCGKTFFMPSALKIHERIHTGEQPYKCIFDGCEETFREKRQMTAHAGRAHDYKQYQCEWCEKRFTVKCNLNNHYRIHTGFTNPFPCKLCTREFNRKKKLRIHLQVIHGEELE